MDTFQGCHIDTLSSSGVGKLPAEYRGGGNKGKSNFYTPPLTRGRWWRALAGGPWTLGWATPLRCCRCCSGCRYAPWRLADNNDRVILRARVDEVRFLPLAIRSATCWPTRWLPYVYLRVAMIPLFVYVRVHTCRFPKHIFVAVGRTPLRQARFTSSVT